MTVLRRIFWTVIFFLGVILFPAWIIVQIPVIAYRILWDDDLPEPETGIVYWMDFCRRMGGNP